MRCFTCNKNVSGDEKIKCNESKHDLDYEGLSDAGYTKVLGNNFGNHSKTDHATILLEFLKKKISRIIISSNNTDRVFCIVPSDEHLDGIEIGTNGAVQWLKATFYDENRLVFSDEMYSRALELVKAKAVNNTNIKKENTFRRIAFVDGEVYYDLGRSDRKIVKITKSEIRIVDFGDNTPFFIKSKGQSEQPQPHFRYDGNPLTELCNLLRIEDPVFPIHLVSFFVENIPVPIMAISGQQGSIKSTISGLVKRIVDPSGHKIEDNLNHLPKNLDDLNLRLEGTYFIAFDNISYITNEVSDSFCKAVTGAAYTKRKLYTDSDEMILRYRRKILLNGISFSMERGDLSERSISYQTDKVPNGERKTEYEVEKKFQLLLPDLLGQIFSLLQKALILYDEVKEKTKNLQRMADFTVWGEAISQALDKQEGKFLQQYKEKLEQSDEILNESNPLFSFLDGELLDRNEICEAANVFFQKLRRYAEANQYDINTSAFPKYSNKLRAFVIRSKPKLDEMGFRIEFFKNTKGGNGFTKNQTLIKITKPSTLTLDMLTNQAGKHS